MANDFLCFAGDPAADVMPQSSYADAAATWRILGFATGVALTPQVNKVWRQSSLIASVIGQFIDNESGQGATDDGTTAGQQKLLTDFTAAVHNVAAGAAQTGYLLLTGGTLSGQLIIATSGPQLLLSAPAGQDAAIDLNRGAAHSAQLLSQTAGSARFLLELANSDPETGGNLGSNVRLSRFADNGQPLGSVFTVSRATGVVDFTNPPTVAGGVMAFLPLAGGTLVGNLDVHALGISYSGLGWNHHIALGWDGTNVDLGVDGTYQGQVATVGWSNNLVGNYLPLSGGALSGALTIDAGYLSVYANCYLRGATFFANMPDWYVAFDGRFKYFNWQANWYDAFDTQTGNRAWGTPSGVMTLDGNNNLNVAGNVTTDGRLRTVGSYPGVMLWNTAAQVAHMLWEAGDGLWFGNVDGGMNIQSAEMRLGNDGVLWVSGGLDSNNWLNVSSWGWVGGNFTSGGTLQCNNGHVICYTGGGAAIYSMITAGGQPWAMWESNWSGGSGTDIGLADGNGNPTAPILSCYSNGLVTAGYFANTCDPSGKQDLRAAPLSFDSLQAICDTKLVSYRRGEIETRFGFTSTDLKQTLPDTVMKPRDEEVVDTMALIAHLFHAVQQLAELGGHA